MKGDTHLLRDTGSTLVQFLAFHTHCIPRILRFLRPSSHNTLHVLPLGTYIKQKRQLAKHREHIWKVKKFTYRVEVRWKEVKVYRLQMIILLWCQSSTIRQTAHLSEVQVEFTGSYDSTRHSVHSSQNIGSKQKSHSSESTSEGKIFTKYKSMVKFLVTNNLMSYKQALEE